MMQVREIVTIFVYIYLVISPFVLLFLSRLVKKLLSKEHTKEFNMDEDMLKKLLEATFGEDYTLMLMTYGSLASYEEARAKDFEVMRNYFKYNLKVMQSSAEVLETIAELLDNDSTKALVYTAKTNFDNCCEDMRSFISGEEEAHTRSHKTEEILSHLKNKEHENKS